MNTVYWVLFALLTAGAGAARLLDPALLRLVAVIVTLAPLKRWAAGLEPEPYDWPLWVWRLRLAVAVRCRRNRGAR